MIFVDNHNVTDPRVNLALEEWLALQSGLEGEILLLYVNAPSIIIGRNQNTLAEINPAYIEEQKIAVVRRLSGGGAVYHDLGNLNFSFITPFTPEDFRNFRKFTKPMIQVLQELGAPAELGQRHDITVHGRKISGNAQYRGKQRMITHGTLLFDADLDAVNAALRVDESQISAKGIPSVRSQVANISEFLGQPMHIEELKARLLRGMFPAAKTIPAYHLSGDDWAAVGDLVRTRYATWEWNYGKSMTFEVRKRWDSPRGGIEANIRTHHGVIDEIRLRGNLLARSDMDKLETQLVGVRFEPTSLRAALCDVDLTAFPEGLGVAALVRNLYF